MTMQEPRPWIIGFEGNHDKAVQWHEYYVPSWRIVELEVEGVGSERFVFFLLEEDEVVAVEMDLMGVRSA